MFCDAIWLLLVLPCFTEWLEMQFWEGAVGMWAGGWVRREARNLNQLLSHSVLIKNLFWTHYDHLCVRDQETPYMLSL